MRFTQRVASRQIEEKMKYQTLSASRLRRLATILVMAAFPPVVIAQTGETTPKDTPTQSSCLAENRRLDQEGVHSCPQTQVAILTTANQTNPMGLSLAPIVGPQITIEEARKQFESGAHRGYAPAQVNLGVLYAYGWGVSQNLGTAVYWIGLAADQGNVQALANLGIFYCNGWGVRQDQAKAVRLFQTAAQAGDTGAMTNLGYAYDQGIGVFKNQQLAADWYRKAADRGDATGQNNLADMYLRGEGLAQDDKAAFELFSKAASQGNTGACIKLGYMYLTGRATQKDPETAYAWIKFASNAGDKRGAEYLHSLSSKLTSAQLKHAEERARNLQLRSVSGVQQAYLRP
jgi:TPR repeat protein